MKTFRTTIIALTFVGCSSPDRQTATTNIGAHYSLSSAIHQNKIVSFVEHSKDRPFGSYLAMNINYSPMPSLLQQIENRLGLRLKSRGEAHITTITPPEFDRVLKKHISIAEINQIALKHGIQQARFEIVCLGRGLIDEKSTYFVVVNSPELLQIRRSIAKQFTANGGHPADFNAEQFYPHITIGFTHRDLHLSDGIVKNRTSCFADIKEVSP